LRNGGPLGLLLGYGLMGTLCFCERVDSIMRPCTLI
jgi:amino acid permease